jgi:hypothetical protein
VPEKKTANNSAATILNKFFDKSSFKKIGKASGFVIRKARKIIPYYFVLGFLMSVCNRQITYSGWAIQIGLLSGKILSKQGLFDRIHSGTTAFAQGILKHALLQRTVKNCFNRVELFEKFGKVLLQDSTTLRLPKVLAWLFPGNHSRGEQKAVARIQSIIDIKSMNFLDFVLGAFTQNDQSASKTILNWVKKGDLVIRDLGYFATDTFKKLMEKEVHFLSRLKYGVGIYDEQGNCIALKKLLKRKFVDRWVWIGSAKKIRVRLVMIHLPAAQAAEKKRKARQDRDRRVNHSKEYYQWLEYGVYITSVDNDSWTAKQVANAYKVRWQIEIIFKSWKSGFHLQEIFHEECKNEHRVMVSIYLMLLFICLFMQKIYVHYKNEIETKMGKQIKISLLKLSNFFASHLIEIFSMPQIQLKELITQYCCYEKRDDRMNMALLYQISKK